MNLRPETLNTCKIDYIINGMFLNENNTLLSLATDKGYKIFEAYYLKQVSEDDEIIELLGDLKISLPFYESNLVFFVGSDQNLNFPSTQLVVWDDIKRKKIGMIVLKEKIYEVRVHKEAIYIQIFNKILVFDFKKLSFLFSFSDVNCLASDRLITSHENNPVTLAYQPSSRLYQIKIAKFKLNSNSEIAGKMQYVLTTPFKFVTKYNLSKKGDLAILIGIPNNKVHIYSLCDFRLKFCLDSSYPLNRISNISISRKNKFFSILYNDYNMEIYNLTEETKINTNCECVNQLIENKIENNDNSTKIKGFLSGKFFKSTYNKLQNYFSQNYRKSFAKYKFNPYSNLNFLNDQDVFRMENDHNYYTIVNFEKINEIVS